MKKIYQLSLGFIFTLFCIVSQVHAKTPSDASTTQLMKFLNITVSQSEFKEHFEANFKTQINSLLPNLNARQQPIADQMILDASNLFATNLNFKEISRKGSEAIKRIFTQDEVDLLIQFYSSPEGRLFSKNSALGKTTQADVKAMSKFIAENFMAGFEQKTAELMAVVEAEMELEMRPFMGDLEAIFMKAKNAIDAAK